MVVGTSAKHVVMKILIDQLLWWYVEEILSIAIDEKFMTCHGLVLFILNLFVLVIACHAALSLWWSTFPIWVSPMVILCG